LIEGLIDMEKEVWLQNLTWEEIQHKLDSDLKTIILPVGSTEQHGYHLPVGTDTMVAMALAECAAQETKALVAPPVWFGWSPHHMVLSGTITIRPEVLIELVYDVIQSLHAHGFDRFILLNGHRIVNISWLQIVGERAKRELGVKVALFDPAFMSKSITTELGWGEVGHAEEIESSHLWYYYPELVKMERARDNPHSPDSFYQVDPRYDGDTLSYVPSSPEQMESSVKTAGGTTGEPSKASRKAGKRYHDHLVAKLIQVIEYIDK
jgi:creatinine amidohydrolase